MIVLSAKAQSDKHSIDSLLQLFNRDSKTLDTTKVYAALSLGKVLRFSNSDSALYFSKWVQEYSKTHHYLFGEGGALNLSALLLKDEGKPNQAIRKFEESAFIFKLIRNKKREANAYNNIGLTYEEKGYCNTSLFYYDLALKMYSQLKDSIEMAYTHMNMGQSLRKKGSYPQAVQEYLFALKVYEKSKANNSIAGVHNNLGIVYQKMENWPKAVFHLEKSLELKKEPFSIAITKTNLGELYGQIGDEEKGLVYLQDALTFFRSIDYSEGAAVCLSNAASLYLKEKKFDEAFKFYSESLELANHIENSEGQAVNLNGLANTLLERYSIYQKDGINVSGVIRVDGLTPQLFQHKHNPNVLDEAISYAERALQVALAHGFTEHELEASRILSDCYARQRKFELAYHYQQQVISLNDSVLSRGVYKRLVELEKNYELDKKQRELVLIEKENEVNKLNLSYKAAQNSFLIYGLIFTSILTAIAIYFYINKQRLSEMLKKQFEEIKHQKELIETINKGLQEKALRSQMNPHFVFNALNSIQFLIMKNDTTEAFHYLSKFSTLLRKVLDYSDKPRIDVREEVEMLELYLQLESLRFGNGLKYKIEPDENLMEEHVIPPMMIQPFVENAIVHGLLHKEGERNLSIKFSREEKKIVCSITDNGIGREAALKIKSKKDQVYKSWGVQLTEQRIAVQNNLMNKQSSYLVKDLLDEVGNPAGTCVTLAFDYN